MSGITIKHSTIKFENMDKKAMFVNVPLSTNYLTNINRNYDAIIEAWTRIEKSFQNLENESSGSVNAMFSKYIIAAQKRKNGTIKRKNELDKKLKKDIQSYAKALLDTEILELLKRFEVSDNTLEQTLLAPNPDTPHMPLYNHGDSLGTIPNSDKGVRYQGSSNFTDKNGNEYVATVQCDRYNNDYQVLIFKKDGNGNFQQISSKKIPSTHGNSLSTKYNPKTNKVEIYTTQHYTEHDIKADGSKEIGFNSTKIGKVEYDINNNKFGDSKIIDLGRSCKGSVSVDADNNLYATSSGFTLSVSKGDVTAPATTYKLQGTSGLINQSGCIHGDKYYKVLWDKENNKNYLFTYDLTKKNAEGKVPYTSKIIDSGPKREVQDISWDENLGLIVSINNLFTKENGRSTEYIKV